MSNEPAKMTKAMTKAMRFLSMAALALAGAVMTGCSGSDDNSVDTPQQPANRDNIVTVRTTVSLCDGGAQTRALDITTGEKTFAVGDKIAVTYTNTSDERVTVMSEALGINDITTDKKTATFTMRLNNPKSGSVTYDYPATVFPYDELNLQDGSLESLTSMTDHAWGGGSMTVNGSDVTLPSLTLSNVVAILAITLKDDKGTESKDDDEIITSDLTEVTISTYFPVSPNVKTYYTVRPESGTFGNDVIYVAISEQFEINVDITATDGIDYYTKSMTGKSYYEGNIYNLGWLMTRRPKTVNLANMTGDIMLKNGDTATGELANKVKVSIADGATVTLNGVRINTDCHWTDGNNAGITCIGNATIILADGTTNEVNGFSNKYSGIYVPGDPSNPNNTKTLTIKGNGTLNASTDGRVADGGAGIGGCSNSHCGNIIIEGGTIYATGGQGAAGIGGGSNKWCGNITIEGGNITALGGIYAAGIGSGAGTGGISGVCGNILITGGRISATGGAASAGIGGGKVCGNITISGADIYAMKGSGGPYSIGAGNDATCGTVTVNGVENPISTSPYSYQNP